ncbi:MAG: hypothetical protein HC813_03280 [Planctomycetes bacterium]|nr:hypothetical protein [Planctomycetota bacterium]
MNSANQRPFRSTSQRGGAAFNTVLGAAIVLLVGWTLWNVFDVGTRIRIHTAVGDLVQRRKVEKARTALETSGDRGRVLEALKKELEDDHPSVWGKIELLTTLTRLKESRPVERALESKVPATRRAAAYFLSGDPDRKETVGQIAEEWVGDGGADGRELAAMICGRLGRKGAIPHILKMIDLDAKVAANAALIRQGMAALEELEAPGLIEKAMELARSPEVEMTIRGQAFDLVGRNKNAPTAEVRTLMLSIAQDGNAHAFLRDKAIAVLGGEEYGDEEVWAALQGILFDANLSRTAGATSNKQSENWVVQRFALGSLARTLPLERVTQLLLDRRLYTHPYYAMRVDVATALSVLRMRKRIAVEILCSYLVDEDPRDTQFLLRQEAWLSLWQLTGEAHGVPVPARFAAPPAALSGEEDVRPYLFRASYMRVGVSAEQVEAVKSFTGDLARLKRIREAYEAHGNATDEGAPR